MQFSKKAVFLAHYVYTNLINACDKCQNLRPSLKSKPFQNLPKPSKPMQTVSMDLYELKGIHYICMCDRYLFFCWVSHLTTLRTVTVVKLINGWFKTIGYPQYIYSDNGPQFDSKEFKNYCDSPFITPLNSSPLYAQSNGLLEAAVKAVKYLLIKSDNMQTLKLVCTNCKLFRLQAKQLHQPNCFTNVAFEQNCRRSPIFTTH
jgi:hypothetical protein